MRDGRAWGARALTVLAMVGLLFAAPAPRAAEDPARLGPLASAVLVGEDGVWRGRYEEGRYRLENRTRPSDIRYYYADLEGRGRGGRRAEVAVEVEAEDGGGWAGLLYAFKPDPRFYYVYALTGDGKAVVLRRDEGGLSRLMTIDNELTRGRRARLGLQERGGEIDLLLDGQSVGGIGGRGMGEGGIGIVAAGKGMFGFAGFALAADAPPPAPPSVPPIAQQPAPQPPAPQPPAPQPPAPPQPPVAQPPLPPPPQPTGGDPQLRAAAKMGPLVLEPGADGAWRYGFEPPGWVMRNTSDRSGLVRFWLKDPPRGPRRVTVELAVEADPGTEGAGLLFGRTEAREYFLLLSPGQVVVARFADRNVQALQRWPGPPDLARPHRLELAETARGVRVAVDGVELGEVAGGELLGGQMGIVAFGTGAFAFRGFELAEAGPPPPPPGPPQQQSGPPPPPQPGPWGGQQPGPWGGQPPQPGPWGGQQPGPWGGQQPGPWGGQPPGPWGGQPPQPGPWGGQQPGPWGGQPPGPWQQPPPGPWQQQGGPPAPTPPPAPVIQGDATGEAGIEAVVQLFRQLSESVAQGQVRVSAPPRGWKRHTDRSISSVSVAHPEGWQVFSVARSSTGLAVDFAQVRVTSPDGLHLVEGFASMTNSAVDPDALIEQRLGELTARLGAPQLLREEEWSVQTGAYLTTDWRFRAVRAGPQILVLVAAAQNFGGFGTSVGRAGLRTIVGPAAQFSAFTTELYVPILNSMTGW